MVRTAPMMGWMEHPNSPTIAVTSATCCGVSRLVLGRIMEGFESSGERQSCQNRPARPFRFSTDAIEVRRQRRRGGKRIPHSSEIIVEGDLEAVKEQAFRSAPLYERPVGAEVP